MRKVSFLLALLLIACGNKTESVSLVERYFEAYNTKNYDELNTILAENIVLIDMGDTVLTTKKAFIDLVEFGEVLNAKNEVRRISEQSGKIVVFEAQTNDKIKFFGGKPIKMNTKFTVENGLITVIDAKLETLDQSDMEPKRNAFYEWAESNPEVDDDLMNQLNKSGAKEIKRAMQLFSLSEFAE